MDCSFLKEQIPENSLANYQMLVIPIIVWSKLITINIWQITGLTNTKSSIPYYGLQHKEVLANS